MYCAAQFLSCNPLAWFWAALWDSMASDDRTLSRQHGARVAGALHQLNTESKSRLNRDGVFCEATASHRPSPMASIIPREHGYGII